METEVSLTSNKDEQTESFHSWIILVAVFLFNVILGYHFMALGVYYVRFTEVFETTKAKAGFIASFQWSLASFGSVFASVFIELFGIKEVTVFGTVIFTLGVFCSSFTTSIYMLYVTYGCLTGMGISFTRMASLVIIQEHFNKHRNMATTLSVCGLPCGNIISPIVTSQLLEIYGWRGSLLIHSGIVLHILVLAMLFSPPPSYYYKKTLLTNGKEDNHSSKSGAKSCLKMLDISVLRDLIMVPFVVCVVLSKALMSAFYEHTPSRAVYLGYDLKKAGFLSCAISAGNLVSRILISIFMAFTKMNPIVLTAVGVGLEGLATVVITFFSSYTSLLVFTLLFGGGQGILFPSLILSTVKVAGVENFSKTTAILNIFICLGEFGATPLTGFIFDVTQDYNVPFYVNGMIGGVASLSAVIVYIMYRSRKRKENSKFLTDTAMVAESPVCVRNKHLVLEVDVRARTYTF